VLPLVSESEAKYPMAMPEPDRKLIIETVQRALAEDIGTGDLTTDLLVPVDRMGTATFVAKENGIVAGWEVVRAVFSQIDPRASVDVRVPDGRAARNGETLGTVRATARAVLSGERTALNFLQRMSGIATTAHAYVEAVRGTRAVILDTRKTVPGLRALDKYAVRLGGATNHRVGLFDMMLIKENHIALAGGVGAAVRTSRAKAPSGIAIEVEVRNIAELREALDAAPDRILLDNMPLEMMREAVTIAGGRVPLEASGNMSLERVRAVAETGVDFISVGKLTHSVHALDISLLVEPDGMKG
jgi:nicotinate-nucleotide pyrophosphorylase (carboxylating)